MYDGFLKPIQHVRAGEFVLSRSEETGEFGCREVVEPYSNPDKAIIRIELLAPDGSLEVIEATANHPFYVEGQGWTRVDELDTNDLVPGSTGELLRIVVLESTDRVETVFNFGVEQFHSYFVGELGAWVHNCNKIASSSSTRFVNGVKVVDRRTGMALEGTVDLKPTLDRIASGKQFPHRNDGSVFQNRPSPGKTIPELPAQPTGYYREYVHPTAGVAGPGPQRVVIGKNGEKYYTPDHYQTFIPLQ